MTDTAGRRLAIIAIALPIVLGLIVRLLAWPHQSIVTVDGTSYIRLARDLMGGAEYLTVQPPGYPVMMMPFLLGADVEGVLAARVTALLAGIGAMLLFGLLARRLVSRWGWLAFGLAFATTPILVRYSIVTMSEMPYLLWTAAALLAASHGRWWLAGAFGAAAFHVRPEGMFLVGGLALAAGRRPRAWLGLFSGLVLLGFLPAMIYNHAQSGSWSLTLKDTNIVADTPVQNESIRAVERDPAKPDTGLTARLSQFAGVSLRVWPGRFVAEMKNMARAVGWPWLVAALAGLFLVIRRSTRPAAPPGPTDPDAAIADPRPPPPGRLLAAGLIQLLVVPLFGGVAPVPRLIVPVLPFVLLLGLIAIDNLVRRDRRLGAIAAMAAAAAWFVAALPEAKALRLQEDGYYPELVRAGRELRGILPAEALVMDRKPYTAFYAGTRFEQVPFGSYHATIEAIQRMGGDYLVVDEAVAEVFRPDLMPLVGDSFTMLNEARLQPIWFDPSLQRRHTAVYRIRRRDERAGPPADDAASSNAQGSGSPIPPGREAAVRDLMARVPHQPKLHVLHAEILWLAGRRAEALAEYEAARAAGTFRPVDAERVRLLEAEIAAGDSATAGR
ncbi:MAG TPA: hypothetical protein VF720_04385 [Candidatus Eisenbacteria bacterium]